jgi:hypothetical protein
MNFVWPSLLWVLLLLPLLVALYSWLLKRRRKTTVRLASVSVAKLALGQGPGWRRHVPPLLMLLALAALLLSVARPTATLTLPLSERTIMLAMDVSGSMRAEDVKPNRLVASQEAAKAFVNNLPREVRVGVVSFAGTAAVVQAPTTSRDDVIKAIDRFQLQRGTATGSGIILSLATLFPDDGIEIQHVTGQRNFPGAGSASIAKKDAKPFTPVAPGSYPSAAVIMLTDGQRTTGPDPLDAAKDGRRARHPRVHRGHRHHHRRDHRLRRLEHARTAGRRDAEEHLGVDARRILLCGHGRRSEEGLRVVELADGGRAQGDRSHGAVRRGRVRSWPCWRPGFRCGGSGAWPDYFRPGCGRGVFRRFLRRSLSVLGGRSGGGFLGCHLWPGLSDACLRQCLASRGLLRRRPLVGHDGARQRVDTPCSRHAGIRIDHAGT